MTDQVPTAAIAPGLTTVDKLRMLLDITKKISRSLDLQEILNQVMDTLDSLIPYDAAGIFVVDCGDRTHGSDSDEPCVFQAESVRGYDISELTELHLKIGEGLASRSSLRTCAMSRCTSTRASGPVPRWWRRLFPMTK
jgi:GAF domain-containing protein